MARRRKWSPQSEGVECWCGYVYPAWFNGCPGNYDGKHERARGEAVDANA